MKFKSDAQRKAVFSKQKQTYNRLKNAKYPEVKKVTSSIDTDIPKYKFSSKTTTPLFDNPDSFGYDKKANFEIVYMKPREFIDIAKSNEYDNFQNETFEEYRKQTEYKPSTEKIKEGFKNGDKITLPYLEFDKYGGIEHEGRHRAYASYDLGIEKIPVKLIKSKEVKFPE